MPGIYHSVIIGAAAKNVYDALTHQEGLSAWWTPDTTVFNNTAHFAFGPGYVKEMKILELKQNQQVKWTCVKGASEWIGTHISFNLHAGGKKKLLELYPEIQGQLEQQVQNEVTLLIFHHNGWKEYSPMFSECNYTWALFLRSLKLFCETGTGQPWPNQHSTMP